MHAARFAGVWILVSLLLVPAHSATAWDDTDAKAWVDHFVFSPPPVGETAMDGQPGRLPSVRRAQFPAEGDLVRMSLPFPPGALPQGKGLLANLGDVTVPVDLRVLTVHPDGVGTPRVATPLETRGQGRNGVAANYGWTREGGTMERTE